MKTKEHYVGLDVHKDTVTIAVADDGRDGDAARKREDGASPEGASRAGARNAGGKTSKCDCTGR